MNYQNLYCIQVKYINLVNIDIEELPSFNHGRISMHLPIKQKSRNPIKVSCDNSAQYHFTNIFPSSHLLKNIQSIFHYIQKLL